MSEEQSEEQFSALLAKLKGDGGLLEKLKGAADLDAAVAIVKEAGFYVSKADWQSNQAQQNLELSDEELEGVSGGVEIDRIGGECFSPADWIDLVIRLQAK